MFRQISIAYDVLRNPEAKFKYDLKLSAATQNERFRRSYPDGFRHSRYAEYRFGLMFQQLLTQNYEVGIRIYEQFQRGSKKFSIDDFLGYKDRPGLRVSYRRSLSNAWRPSESDTHLRIFACVRKASAGFSSFC